MKDCICKNLYFWIFASVAMSLLIISFFMPPKGMIDPSVIQGVAELFGFASLGAVYKAIEKSESVTLKHNNTEITLKDEKEG